MMPTVASGPKVLIAIGPGNSISNPDRGNAQPSAFAHFLVQNHDTVPHVVSLHTFEPGGGNPTGPKDPIDPDSPTSVTVAAHATQPLDLKIKDGGYFAQCKNPTYKYTIESDGKVLDPELEINN
jgi:hypothetical protein